MFLEPEKLPYNTRGRLSSILEDKQNTKSETILVKWENPVGVEFRRDSNDDILLSFSSKLKTRFNR